MQAKLIVKKFGPIEEVNLDLRNVNVFIGPQASGKSALAKVYTICKSPLSFYNEDVSNEINVEKFKKKLEDYNVSSFLQNDTYIEFESEIHSLTYTKNKLTFHNKLLREINNFKKLCKDYALNKKEILKRIIEFSNKLLLFRYKVLLLNFKLETFDYDSIEEAFNDRAKFEITDRLLDYIIFELNKIASDLLTNSALYIPSERNLIPIIRNSALNLISNDVPIPKHILSLGAEYEKASAKLSQFDLSFIKEGLQYKFESGTDKIYFSKNNSIKLLEAASGIQTIVPLLLPILAKREKGEDFMEQYNHISFVIEEPELNLFPKAQYQLIQLLEKGRIEPANLFEDIGTIHTYTTHSPFILASFNNFLYAYIIGKTLYNKYQSKNEKGVAEEVILAVVSNKIKAITSKQINPNNFSAYQISNGSAISILNRETGLIVDNYIDQASDEMGDDFDKLMQLLEEETL